MLGITKEALLGERRNTQDKESEAPPDVSQTRQPEPTI